MSCLHRTYWPCGGDIVTADGCVIGPAEAERLRRSHLDEAACARRAEDAAAALRVAAELDQALVAGARWRRAAVARLGWAASNGRPATARELC